MNVLDRNYQNARLMAFRKVEAAAMQTWFSRPYGADDEFVKRVLPIVQGGMLQAVHLLNAYFVWKARIATGNPRLPMVTVPASEFEIEKLRGVPAKEVYSRPFGALGNLLEGGMSFKTADRHIGDYVQKLVATDLQLAQTHAARSWIGDRNGGTA